MTGSSRSCPPVGRGRAAQRLAWAAIGLVLGACAPGCIGPRGVELTRLQYDQAVHTTNEQLWLRNLVRLRYGEPPTFLDVSTINSQFELTTRGAITGGLERASQNHTLVGDLGAQFRDAPTLTYAPRSPTEITRAMVAPVGITALGLMSNTGWRPEVVMRLMISEMNGVPNATGADQILPKTPPEPSEFADVLTTVGRLLATRAAAMTSEDESHAVSPPVDPEIVKGSDLVAAAAAKLEFREADGSGPRLVLTRNEPVHKLEIALEVADHPDVEAFRAALHLAPGRPSYRVRRAGRVTIASPRPIDDVEDEIRVQTRTVLEMMAFLAKGVAVPPEHVSKGLAFQTPGPDGALFDWTAVTTGLFRVCAQEKKPRNAAVAVPYRGYWFYIAENDHRSREALALIQAMLDLQIEEPSRPAPLLTLPIGI